MLAARHDDDDTLIINKRIKKIDKYLELFLLSKKSGELCSVDIYI